MKEQMGQQFPLLVLLGQSLTLATPAEFGSSHLHLLLRLVVVGLELVAEVELEFCFATVEMVTGMDALQD